MNAYTADLVEAEAAADAHDDAVRAVTNVLEGLGLNVGCDNDQAEAIIRDLQAYGFQLVRIDE